MLPPLPRCSRWAYLSLENRPSVSTFPDSTFGSACTSTFSRIARRLLALRPAHSRGHQFRDRYPGASDISSPPCLPRLLPAGAVAGWGLHPLDKRRLVTAHADTSHSQFGERAPRFDAKLPLGPAVFLGRRDLQRASIEPGEDRCGGVDNQRVRATDRAGPVPPSGLRYRSPQ